jgi:pilus assembly protein CpaE
MTRAHVVAVEGAPSFPPQVARALGASAEDVDWIASASSAERAVIEAERPIDLLVLGPSVHDEQAVAVAELVAKRAPTTAVVLVREQPVNGALPRLVRSGVRDVVDLSQGGADLEDALRRALEWSASVRAGNGHATTQNGSSREGRVISVFSTKGGTGKTFLSCNLAAALAERTKQQVGLVDLDHDLGDVFGYFGTDPQRSLHDLVALAEGADAQTVSALGTPLAKGVTGFASPPDPRADAIPSGAMGKVVRALQQTFPYTVVDATSEYSDHILTTFDLSDIVCLIASLDVISLRHLSLGIQTLESLGVPRERFRIVLNRANSKVGLLAAEVERALQIQIDARIPSSPLVPRSINHAQLLYVNEPRSSVAKSIGQLAELLHRQLAPSAPAQGAPNLHVVRRG